MPYDMIIGRDEADKARFGAEGLIYLGKGYVKMGMTSSLSNRILMDVARSHVLLIAGKRGCLVGDTKIYTDKGYTPIKNFEEKEDKVLSFNKKTQKFEWENAKLLKYKLSNNEKLLRFKLADGRTLVLTKEHPLMTLSKNPITKLIKKKCTYKWKKAYKFKEGDKVLSVDKHFYKINPVPIIKISEVSGIKEVYDLTVGKNHSFVANRIISHNSGKSYTLGVIAEELASLPEEVGQNISTLIFDTMGIFWTMAYANEKEHDLMKSWNIQPKKLPVRIFVPSGFAKEYQDMGIPVTKAFSFKASELSVDDWNATFNIDMLNPASIVLQRIISNLKEWKKDYDLDGIINEIQKDKEASADAKAATMNLFEAAKTWGIFVRKGEKGTAVSELIEGGSTTILDLSTYSSTATFNVRALVIGLITKKLFLERMLSRKKEEVQAVSHGLDYLRYKEKREMPLVWVLIDELHEFLPENGKTAATDALIQLLREGRQPGISLAGATQQPGKVHSDIWTQADIVISHRVTAKPDVAALSTIMQTYLAEDISNYMNQLPSLKGSAIILDDNSERIYPVRMRARFTWHGGESPTSVKIKKRI